MRRHFGGNDGQEVPSAPSYVKVTFRRFLQRAMTRCGKAGFKRQANQSKTFNVTIMALGLRCQPHDLNYRFESRVFVIIGQCA